MRKTFEAIQAWRRQHDGRYPNRLIDLKDAGLLGANDGICPAALAELAAADGTHGFISSVGQGLDPEHYFEYELSNRKKWKQDVDHLPTNFSFYTRQDLKVELLRRPFFEQIPILRCSRHRLESPETHRSSKSVFRNLPVTGVPYWDKGLWELNWLSDVPYCAREANVIFGLKGPPFHSDQPPLLHSAMDLRKWSCAFGDAAWWWTYPMFGQGTFRQSAPHLGPFFQGRHGRVVELDGATWWLDGLVQLQGKVSTNRRHSFTAPTMEAFVWKRTNLSVDRVLRGASWLQGTVWIAKKGEIAGWLVWHFTDGKVVRVPMVYGETTGRFWGDAQQIQTESKEGHPAAVWNHHESAETTAGNERWLRLYRQTWVNPHPDVKVASLDFESNQDCYAAPFIIAVNVTP